MLQGIRNVQSEIDTSLPQNKHLLVNRQYGSDLEQTYLHLKKFLNLKEFRRHERTKNTDQYRKMVLNKAYMNKIRTLQ